MIGREAIFLRVFLGCTRQRSEVQILSRLPGKTGRRAVPWMAFLFFEMGNWVTRSSRRAMRLDPSRQRLIDIVAENWTEPFLSANGTIWGHSMETKYKSEHLISSIEGSFLFLVSGLAMGNYLLRFGQTHVFPNLKDIGISNYIMTKEVQEQALKKVSFERVAISGALRGIYISMNEVLQKNPIFYGEISKLLKENCETFSDLIRLLRNAYSHEITWISRGDVILKEEDFKGFISYRKKSEKSMVLSLTILYADLMPDVPIPRKNYGIHLSVSLENLQEGKPLTSIIIPVRDSVWNLI
jgi:hypothetical protein